MPSRFSRQPGVHLLEHLVRGDEPAGLDGGASAGRHRLIRGRFHQEVIQIVLGHAGPQPHQTACFIRQADDVFARFLDEFGEASLR